jgi:hypothetical protein
LIVIASILAAFVLVAGIKLIQIAAGKASPLGEAMPLNFPSVSISEVQHFLDDDFKPITDVRYLPRPVLSAFTEQGGTRLLIANPGKKFEVSDAIFDASVPRKRLIFAGVSGKRCFVYYEQGGSVHEYLLAFLVIQSGEDLKPLWLGGCDSPAADIGDLRSAFINGRCRLVPSSSL